MYELEDVEETFERAMEDPEIASWFLELIMGKVKRLNGVLDEAAVLGPRSTDEDASEYRDLTESEERNEERWVLFAFF